MENNNNELIRILKAREPMLTRIYSEVPIEAGEYCVGGGRLEYRDGGILRVGMAFAGSAWGLTAFVAGKFGSSMHWFAGRKRLDGCCLGLRGGGCRGRFGGGAWRYYDRRATGRVGLGRRKTLSS